jgi:hypothetical protein
VPDTGGDVPAVAGKPRTTVDGARGAAPRRGEEEGARVGDRKEASRAGSPPVLSAPATRLTASFSKDGRRGSREVHHSAEVSVAPWRATEPTSASTQRLLRTVSTEEGVPGGALGGYAIPRALESPPGGDCPNARDVDARAAYHVRP